MIQMPDLSAEGRCLPWVHLILYYDADSSPLNTEAVVRPMLNQDQISSFLGSATIIQRFLYLCPYNISGWVFILYG